MGLVMYDSTNIGDIPRDAAYVLAYVGGNPAFTQVPAARKRFPKARILGLAVASRYDAEGVDVERGDVPNALVAGWVKRQLARGVHRPVVYTSAANVATIVKLLAANGILRSQVRILSAHYNYKKHVCSPNACGYPTADGTQWTNRSGGHHLDESFLLDDFFAAAPKPKPVPVPPKPTPAPTPTPVPPKPAPTPGVVNRYLRITDKDGSDTYLPYTKLARLRRGIQFSRGKFNGLAVVNEKV